MFLDRLKTASYQSHIRAKQAFLCGLAASYFPSSTPLPDEIQPALGLNYDFDLLYVVDKRGSLRTKLDASIGYAGWSGVITKSTGQFSLHTIVPLACDEHILQVRYNICNAYKPAEQLVLVADIADRLIYRSIRTSDPDYEEVILSNLRL
jgi:hypothetical protein